jgi:hypothetical protein
MITKTTVKKAKEINAYEKNVIDGFILRNKKTLRIGVLIRFFDGKRMKPDANKLNDFLRDIGLRRTEATRKYLVEEFTRLYR